MFADHLPSRTPGLLRRRSLPGALAALLAVAPYPAVAGSLEVAPVSTDLQPGSRPRWSPSPTAT